MKKLKYMYGENLSIEFSLPSFAEADRYYHILKDSEDPGAEEYVFGQITDLEYDLESIPAGVVLSVIFSAIKMAGVIKTPTELPAKIENARNIVSSDIIATFYSMIIKAMPSYNPDILKAKTLNEILELLSMAELVFGQPMIDLAKLKESLKIEDKNVPKKGLSGTSKEEIQALMGLMDRERALDGPEI